MSLCIITIVTPEEIAELRARLQSLQRRQRRETPRIEGVGPTAARVLGAIARAADADAPARPAAVAAELGMQRPNVASALRELETAGLVERGAVGGDARAVALRLSPAGAAAVAAHRHGRDTWFASAVEAALSPAEQAQLRAAGELIDRLARADPA